MRKNNVFEVSPLASGSRGNSFLISTPETNILVDAGLSGIEIKRRLYEIGRMPEDIKAILITHEHIDHIKGIGVLNRRFNIPVYINQKTFLKSKALGTIKHVEFFNCGTSFYIGAIKINPFSVSHDAGDPSGFTFRIKKKKIGIATDLGYVSTLVKEHLKNCTVLFLEANHDPDMLINGQYPWHIKQRIHSRTGHLSNIDTRDLIAEIIHPDLKHVFLCHLSEENNRPEKACQEVAKSLNQVNVRLSVARPTFSGQIFSF